MNNYLHTSKNIIKNENIIVKIGHDTFSNIIKFLIFDDLINLSLTNKENYNQTIYTPICTCNKLVIKSLISLSNKHTIDPITGRQVLDPNVELQNLINIERYVIVTKIIYFNNLVNNILSCCEIQFMKKIVLLGYLEISDSDIEYISNFINLKSLKLSVSDNVTNNGICKLSKLINLRELVIYGDNNLNYDFIKSFTNLYYIDIDDGNYEYYYSNVIKPCYL